ncbi:MAG: hypothetical protein DI523_28385 [Paraburkholderia fungorum]|nr:MAG: hypothetical protein DI523_28385 [Paraburkholderia fungorum]
MACVAFAVQSRSLPRLHSQQRDNGESGGGGKRESETALRAQRGNNESGNGDNRKNGTQPGGSDATTSWGTEQTAEAKIRRAVL